MPCDEGSLLLADGELVERTKGELREPDGLDRVAHRRVMDRVSPRHHPRWRSLPAATISSTVAGTSDSSEGRWGT